MSAKKCYNKYPSILRFKKWIVKIIHLKKPKKCLLSRNIYT